ncbi:efflux RND transporter permease subunit [Candidatus Williamhamiltonella defendens]|uniref:efflux RND transporter permease subunit n=1 Tax=Candidatus Williamhamiltonella defendens TaxID=138072 RepID=UPI00387E3142
MVPFSSFSSTQWKYNSPRLERYNGFPSMKIQGQSTPAKSTGETVALMQELAKKLPNGISVMIGVTPLSRAYVC